MIDAGIYALLAADAGVAALVGGNIFAGAAPPDESQLPCIVYRFVGGSSEPTFQNAGMIKQRVEISGGAVNPSGGDSPGTVAAKIVAAVIKAFNGWQQVLGDGTNVSCTYLLNPGTDLEPRGLPGNLYQRDC